MLITEIKRQRGHLVGLYCNDELVLSIDCDLAAELNLKKMQDYPEDFLRELLEKSESRRAKSKALYLLEFRDYSSRALEQRLRKDFDEEFAREAVEYMEEIGAIDDRRYAEALTRQIIRQKLYGRRRIKQELVQKGVDRDIADEVIEDADIDEQAMILELLERKFSRDLNDQKGITRTIASLQRYGYNFGDIKSALREYIDDESDFE